MGCASSKNALSATPVLDHQNSDAILERTLSKSPDKEQKEEGKEEKEKGDIVKAKETEKEAEKCTKSDSVHVENIAKKTTEREPVAAGWPIWLTAVAAEAIKGWVPLKAENFEKLDKIGQGTYSNVFKARDLGTGKIVALKKVRFDNFEPESVKFMAREIEILRRLDHPNIMKLEGLIASRFSCNIYLVFEYMEHDLAGLSSSPDIRFIESQIKCYLKQLLCGLEHCHSRGIIHRDIKGANLLVNDEGVLKIADFGLANFVQTENNNNKKNPLTSRVVTLWYRPPELLLGSVDYGTSVDLWSVGCVFAEMFLRNPILQGRTEVEQLHRIFKLCGSPSEEYWKKSKLPHEIIFKPSRPYESHLQETFRSLPQSAFKLLQIFLSVEPQKRGTAASALASEYFTTMPLPCEPSRMPKYPPTKEMDTKIDFCEDDAGRKKTTKEKDNDKAQVAEVARRPLRAHREPQKPNGLSLLSNNHHEAEPRKNNHGTDKSSDKLVCSRVNGGSRLLVDLQPMATLNPSDCGRQTKHVSQGDIRSLGALHVKKTQEDRPFVKSHSKSTTKSITRGGAPEPSGAIRARVSVDFDNKANRHEPIDQHKKNEQYKMARKAMVRNWARLERPDSFDSSKFHSHDFSRRGVKQSKRAVPGYHDEGERVEFSGPLLSKSKKVDELLEKHDRQIQRAVRKSWFDRVAGRKQVK